MCYFHASREETEAQGWEMTDIVTWVTSLVIHSGMEAGSKVLDYQICPLLCSADI